MITRVVLIVVLIWGIWYMSAHLDNVYRGIESIESKQKQIILLISPQYPVLKLLYPKDKKKLPPKPKSKVKNINEKLQPKKK